MEESRVTRVRGARALRPTLGERGRGLSLGGGARRENIGRNDGLGCFPLVEVVEWSRGGAGCLWWHRNDAFLDDDGGDDRVTQLKRRS